MKQISLLFIVSVFFSSCSPFFATKYQLSTNETLDGNDLGLNEEVSILEADTVLYYSFSLFPRVKSSGTVRHLNRIVYIHGLRRKTSVIRKFRISRRTFRNEFSKYAASNPSKHKSYSSISLPRTNTPTSGATIHTGPRGGRYYINSNGNKTYVKKGASSSGTSSRRTKSSSSKTYSKTPSRKSSSGSKYKSSSTKSRSSISKSTYRPSKRR